MAIGSTFTHKQRNANWQIVDPGAGGAIPFSRSGQVELTGAGSRTLAAPTRSNLELGFVGKAVTGTITVTVASAYTEDGDTIFQIRQNGEFVSLKSFEVAAGTFAWRQISSDTTDELVVPGVFYKDSGTVTQETNISTGVEINTTAGIITTQVADAAAGAENSFAVTCEKAFTSSVIPVTANYSGGGTPVVTALSGDGEFTIVITNVHASAALDAALTINYAIISLTTS